MNNHAVALKYLKLILVLVVCLVLYTVYRSNIPLPFINKPKQTKAPATAKEQEQLQKVTQQRLKNYETYLKTAGKDLKTLEASASIDITKDLLLDKPYLEDLRTK